MSGHLLELIPKTFEYNDKQNSSQEKTDIQYKAIIDICRKLFINKAKDYGTSWRILRLPSITDQIWIKAKRIRSIQEKGSQQVDDPIRDEFIGIINYSIIALIQLSLSDDKNISLNITDVSQRYDSSVHYTMELHHRKNSDYGEAWRDMRISSIVDIILQKLLRVKQIEDNNGETVISENVDANYRDIMNYAIFCLIKMDEQPN